MKKKIIIKLSKKTSSRHIWDIIFEHGCKLFRINPPDPGEEGGIREKKYSWLWGGDNKKLDIVFHKRVYIYMTDICLQFLIGSEQFLWLLIGRNFEKKLYSKSIRWLNRSNQSKNPVSWLVECAKRVINTKQPIED